MTETETKKIMIVERTKVKQMSDDLLTLEYVYLRTLAKWARNAKKHGLQKIIDSIYKHGFKDPLKYEPELNDGAGGIVEGNGRDDALLVMFSQNKNAPPRGVVYDGAADDWIIPVLFGVDAESQAAAESYGIDHNNTTLTAVFTEEEIMRLYTVEVAPVIIDLDKSETSPSTISPQLAETISKAWDQRNGGGSGVELVGLPEESTGENGDGGESGETYRLHNCPKCGHVSEVKL